VRIRVAFVDQIAALAAFDIDGVPLGADVHGADRLHLEFMLVAGGIGAAGIDLPLLLAVAGHGDGNRLHDEILNRRLILGLGQLGIVATPGGEKGFQRRLPERTGDEEQQGK
jgi:hypothetical protein